MKGGIMKGKREGRSFIASRGEGFGLSCERERAQERFFVWVLRERFVLTSAVVCLLLVSLISHPAGVPTSCACLVILLVCLLVTCFAVGIVPARPAHLNRG